MDTRQLAHRLVDRLEDLQLNGLVQFLETIVDQAQVALADAPVDDEGETAAERDAVVEAHRWLAKNGGTGIPHVDALKRLGLE